MPIWHFNNNNYWKFLLSWWRKLNLTSLKITQQVTQKSSLIQICFSCSFINVLCKCRLGNLSFSLSFIWYGMFSQCPFCVITIRDEFHCQVSQQLWKDLNFRLFTEFLLPSTAGSRVTTSEYCNYTRLDYGCELIQSVLFSRRHTNVASALFMVLNSVQFVVCVRDSLPRHCLDLAKKEAVLLHSSGMKSEL